MSFNELNAQESELEKQCQCWVGHGSCGGCSGVIGIKHEPACGYEYNPDCPVHGEDITKEK